MIFSYRLDCGDLGANSVVSIVQTPLHTHLLDDFESPSLEVIGYSCRRLFRIHILEGAPGRYAHATGSNLGCRQLG